MKKPHLAFQRVYGDWLCIGETYVGCGKTPREAYKNWANRPDWADSTIRAK